MIETQPEKLEQKLSDYWNSNDCHARCNREWKIKEKMLTSNSKWIEQQM